jgi:phage terminase small subunit
VAQDEQGNVVASILVKNPWTTVLHQYRAHWRSLTGELGLSPASARRVTPPPAGDDDDDPFA